MRKPIASEKAIAIGLQPQMAGIWLGEADVHKRSMLLKNSSFEVTPLEISHLQRKGEVYGRAASVIESAHFRF